MIIWIFPESLRCPSLSPSSVLKVPNRKRRSREADQSHAKKFCAKNLNLKDTTGNCVKWSANVTAVQHDHMYFCNREQTTPVENMVGELLEGKSSAATQTDLQSTKTRLPSI